MPKPKNTKVVACVKHYFEYWSFPAWLADALREHYPGLNVVHLPDYARLGEELIDADIFLGFSIRPEQFAGAKKLKWIHSTAAGVDQFMRDDIRNSSVVITNSRGVMTPPMAEHTLGLILALARRFASALRYQEKKQWAQTEIWNETPPPMMVQGRTLLIIGYGAIGQLLARPASVLGMRIVGIKRDPAQGTEHADEVLTPDRLLEALPRADFVVLATPVTPATDGAFGREQFAAMKETAFFLNVGRGTLVDTPALIEALERKQIAGAALDVAEQEPLPPEHPLWSAPNLFITPHLSATSDQLWQRQRDLLFDNMDRWFRGDPLLNVVDKERGY